MNLLKNHLLFMARSEAADSKSNDSADFVFGLVLEIGQILQNIRSIGILDVSVTFQHLWK